MEKFNVTWSRFDPDATGFIPIYLVHRLLTDLGPPMGFRETETRGSRAQRDAFIAQLEMPTYHNFESYSYHDLLYKLALKLTVMEHVKKKKEEKAEKLLQIRNENDT